LRLEAAELEIGEDLLGFDALTLETIVALGRKGVKTLDDLADLAADELVELLPDGGLTEDEAGALIMAARAHWFPTDGAAAAEDDAPEAAADGAEAPADEAAGDEEGLRG
jgi:N utilization substance protein A